MKSKETYPGGWLQRRQWKPRVPITHFFFFYDHTPWAFRLHLVFLFLLFFSIYDNLKLLTPSYKTKSFDHSCIIFGCLKKLFKPAYGRFGVEALARVLFLKQIRTDKHLPQLGLSGMWTSVPVTRPPVFSSTQKHMEPWHWTRSNWPSAAHLGRKLPRSLLRTCWTSWWTQGGRLFPA